MVQMMARNDQIRRDLSIFAVIPMELWVKVTGQTVMVLKKFIKKYSFFEVQSNNSGTVASRYLILFNIFTQIVEIKWIQCNK